MRRLLPTILLFTTACEVEVAPVDVDEALLAWWRAWPEDDARLGRLASETLDVVAFDALLDGNQEGTQSRLLPEDLEGLLFEETAGVPRDPPDPALARPLYQLDRQPCDIQTMSELVAYPDQNELYGQYESYSRSYHGDAAAFRRGDSDTLAWRGTISVKNPLIPNYTYEFETEARRFALGDDERLGDTVGLVFRTWMPVPGQMENPDKNVFDQDYQLEVYLPLADGDALHLYPVWRRMDLNGLGTMENDANATVTLLQMAKWGRRTVELCTDGIPPVE